MKPQTIMSSIVAISMVGTACGGPASDPADLVLVDGVVISVDAEDSVHEAVAVRGERIVAVGSSEEIRDLIGTDTRIIELNGRAVTPGLLDAHAHFNGSALERMYVLDLSYPNVKSVADIVEAVRERVEQVGPGEWIQGVGWDEGKLEELRHVLAEDLDAVAPGNPVWLTQTMGHYGTANSAAMELAGVDRNTADPPGGTIDRLPSGDPTGVFKESAQRLATRLIPRFSSEQLKIAMADLADAFNGECMTGVKDPGIGQRAWDAYSVVMNDGDLSVRVFALWREPETVAETTELIERIGATTRPYEGRPNDLLISGGVKFFLDGSGGARTAWMYDDWNRERTEVDEGNTGYPARDPEVIRESIKMLHGAGIHVSTHAIGDRAIDWTVDSYAQALADSPTPGLRHGIIHANIPTDHAISEIARMQRDFDAAYPEPSPGFTWWIGDTYAGNFGEARSQRLNPLRTFRDNGIEWASGSDYNVTPFAARYGIWAAVARETELGVYGPTPFGTTEAVDAATALRSYTMWVAQQMFLEDEIGSIEVGKYADLAVWDRDPLSVATADLRGMMCEATVFNGELAYER